MCPIKAWDGRRCGDSLPALGWPLWPGAPDATSRALARGLSVSWKDSSSSHTPATASTGLYLNWMRFQPFDTFHIERHSRDPIGDFDLHLVGRRPGGPFHILDGRVAGIGECDEIGAHLF